jgi:hypothetical protein
MYIPGADSKGLLDVQELLIGVSRLGYPRE